MYCRCGGQAFRVKGSKDINKDTEVRRVVMKDSRMYLSNQGCRWWCQGRRVEGSKDKDKDPGV